MLIQDLLFISLNHHQISLCFCICQYTVFVSLSEKRRLKYVMTEYITGTSRRPRTWASWKDLEGSVCSGQSPGTSLSLLPPALAYGLCVSGPVSVPFSLRFTVCYCASAWADIILLILGLQCPYLVFMSPGLELIFPVAKLCMCSWHGRENPQPARKHWQLVYCQQNNLKHTCFGLKFCFNV